MRGGSKEPLYRKVNTRARGVHHRKGPDFGWQRNTKAETTAKADGVLRGKMRQGVLRGLDYTPLFRFLLSRVGQDWDKVHFEALSRLDRAEPIFWMVAQREEDRKRYFLHGDNSSSADFSSMGTTVCNWSIRRFPWRKWSPIAAVARTP